VTASGVDDAVVFRNGLIADEIEAVGVVYPAGEFSGSRHRAGGIRRPESALGLKLANRVAYRGKIVRSAMGTFLS